MGSKSEKSFVKAAAAMEQALADSLQAAISAGKPNTGAIERLLKLIIKKEIILEFLIEETKDFDDKD